MTNFNWVIRFLLAGMIVLFSTNTLVAKEAEVLFPIIKGELWGYIDSSGEVVVAPKYHRASQFYDGLGLVQTVEPENKKFFIDTKGDLAFEVKANWLTVKPFHEGLARVRDKETRLYGYIDLTGKIVIPFKYSSANDFSEGLAKVEIKDAEKNHTYGFIDKKGNVAIKLDKWMKNDFSDGLASVRTVKDGKFGYGYIDTKGEMVIPPRFKKVGYFSEGLAFVNDNGQIQMIDKKGEVVGKFDFKAGDFDRMPKFSHGLAKLDLDWKFPTGFWGFVDKKGKLAFPELDMFYIKDGFSEGRAWIKLRGSKDYVLIDTKGKIYTKVPNVKSIIGIKNGITALILKKEKKIYYYDREGQLILK
jgi:hypothetical protein